MTTIGMSIPIERSSSVSSRLSMEEGWCSMTRTSQEPSEARLAMLLASFSNVDVTMAFSFMGEMSPRGRLPSWTINMETGESRNKRAHSRL